LTDIWEEIGEKLSDVIDGDVACIDSNGNLRFTNFQMDSQIEESVTVALHTKVRVSLSLEHGKVLILPMNFGGEEGIVVVNRYDLSEDTFVRFMESIVEDTFNLKENLSRSEKSHKC